MHARKLFLVMLLALLAGLVPLFASGRPASGAGSLPAGFGQVRLVGGLKGPTAMEFAPDGRLFVAEQAGRLRVVKSGRLLAAPFFDISSKVDSSGERGLLGVTLDPSFETNHYVYVYYTRRATSTSPAVNRVSRFTANGDRAGNGSERVVFQLNPLGGALTHNGGALHFGTDGRLYVAVGDNAVRQNAQRIGSLNGKMLRINPNGSIPADNPFYGVAVGKNRAIWARGLRNPYSFAVQPGTGRILINDVGQSAYEEINVGRSGANYGWPVHEGPENDGRYDGPLRYYGHGSSATRGCAITGGAFYDPARVTFPAEYVGDYFFADFCSGWIRRFDPEQNTTLSTFKAGSGEMPVDLKVNANGDLFFLARATGSVEKIRYAR